MLRGKFEMKYGNENSGFFIGCWIVCFLNNEGKDMPVCHCHTVKV